MSEKLMHLRWRFNRKIALCRVNGVKTTNDWCLVTCPDCEQRVRREALRDDSQEVS